MDREPRGLTKALLGRSQVQGAWGEMVLSTVLERSGLRADADYTAQKRFAAEKNVAITTPTTLMVAIRTVANVWQVERRKQNAEYIANRAGKLYEKQGADRRHPYPVADKLARSSVWPLGIHFASFVFCIATASPGCDRRRHYRPRTVPQVEREQTTFGESSRDAGRSVQPGFGDHWQAHAGPGGPGRHRHLRRIRGFGRVC